MRPPELPDSICKPMNFTLVLDQGLQALLVVSLSRTAVGRVAGWPRSMLDRGPVAGSWESQKF